MNIFVEKMKRRHGMEGMITIHNFDFSIDEVPYTSVWTEVFCVVDWKKIRNYLCRQ